MEDIDAGTSTTPSSYSFVVCLALKDVSQSTNAQFDNLTLTINNHSLQDEVNYDDFVFNYDDYDYYEFDVCTIAEYTGSETKVIFPKTDPNGKLINMIGYDESSVLPSGTLEVYVPDGVNYIGSCAFDSIYETLRFLYLPNSIKSIGAANTYLGISPAFILPSQFGTGGQGEGFIDPDETAIVRGGAVSYAISSSSDLFATKEGLIVSKGNTELSYYPLARTGAFEIPLGVTSLGDYAFSQCTSLTEVTIPSGVTSIGWGTFSYCTSLSEITIPSSVESISGPAFLGTPWLEILQSENNGIATASDGTKFAIDIPTTITKIDLTNVKVIAGNAFYNCSSLSSVTIPSSVESIGRDAFSNCNSLNSVTFEASDSVWTLDDSNNTEIRVNEHNASVLATYLTKSTYVTPPGYCDYTWTKN